MKLAWNSQPTVVLRLYWKRRTFNQSSTFWEGNFPCVFYGEMVALSSCKHITALTGSWGLAQHETWKHQPEETLVDFPWDPFKSKKKSEVMSMDCYWAQNTGGSFCSYFYRSKIRFNVIYGAKLSAMYSNRACCQIAPMARPALWMWVKFNTKMEHRTLPWVLVIVERAWFFSVHLDSMQQGKIEKDRRVEEGFVPLLTFAISRCKTRKFLRWALF